MILLDISNMKGLKEKLIKAGYKITKPRLCILEFLFKNHTSISARELHKKIKKFDQASIYRALNLFEKLHLVNVDIVNKEKIYCLADKPHHHIICQKCGYMEKIECNHSFQHFKNFTNVYHQLTLTGVCNKCVS